MRLNTLILLLFTGLLSLQAQPPYGHEWIDFSNPNPTFRFKIAHNGLYRIEYGTLESALAATGHNIANVDAGRIQLWTRGAQVPIYIEGGGNGTIDPGDFIEFYGLKNDGWLDERLYMSPGHQINKYYSNFNDTSSYYLTWTNNPNAPTLRLQDVANNLVNPPAKEQYFIHTKTVSYQGTWSGGEAHAESGVLLYDSRFLKGEGYTQTPFNKTSITNNIEVDHVYTAGPVQQATVRTNVISYYNQQHRLRFSLNGTMLMDTIFGTSQQGQFVNLFSNTAPLGILKKTQGQADEFRWDALGTGSSDRNAIGYIEIDYPRTFNFGGASDFRFKVTGGLGSSRYIEIENFNHQSQAPVLVDLGNRQRIIGTVDNNLVKYRINLSTSNTADCRVVAMSELREVNNLVPVQWVNFSQQANQGTYLIITHPSLRNDGQGNDWVRQFAQYRASIIGGNYQVLEVDINTLFDQFAYGVAKHPLAIKGFLNFAVDSFITAPIHVFLIGKSLEYQLARTDQGRYALNMVPTFGHPGSDMMLTTLGNSLSSRISVGRIAARNGSDVRYYYDKVVALEESQRNPGERSVKNNSWRKQLLHLAGGINSFEQGLFRQLLGDYEKTIIAQPFGGNVYNFQKTSPDPIQQLKSRELDSMINNGLAIITFFGHSSINSFDANLDNPNNYDNYGRYPLLISNGCFAGQIHAVGTGVSEEFIFARDRGAIGFISSVSYGAVWALNTFTNSLYKNIGRYHFYDDVGRAMLHTMRFISDTLASDPLRTFLLQQNTLHGDPAVRVAPDTLPDLVVEPQFITFSPASVTADMDSFDVAIQVYNLGMAIDSTITVSIQRNFADGSFTLQSKEIKAPYYQTTLVFRFYTDPVRGLNLNTFEVTADAGDVLVEMTKLNNTATQLLYIRSSEAFPVYPYRYGIVGAVPPVLKANTSDLLEENWEYVFEIDTTALFNSLQKQEGRVNSIGGVIEWTPQGMNWMNETVYYWRISPEFSHPDSARWNASSFVYADNSREGWNQSHYFQLTDANYANVELLPDRSYKFVDDLKELRLSTGQYPSHDWTSEAVMVMNGDILQRWSCLGPGGQALIIAVIDSLTGLTWKSTDYQFGQAVCNYNYMRDAFHFQTNTQTNRKKIIDFLDSVPGGHYIALLSFQKVNYVAMAGDTSAFGTSVLKKLVELGAWQFAGLDTLGIRPPIAMFTQKGNPVSTVAIVGDMENSLLDTTVSFSGRWNQGYILSRTFGPATAWDRLTWDIDPSKDPHGTGTIGMDVLVVDTSGNEWRIISNLTAHDTSLAQIDAVEFPMMRLQFHTRDDDNRTAAHFEKWRVTFDPIGDLAINPARHFSFIRDTLVQGEDLKLEVAVENIGTVGYDSVEVHVSMVSNDNVRTQLGQMMVKPLAPGDTAIVRYTMPTNNLEGAGSLVVELNPGNKPAEQYRYNNLLFVPFTVERDIHNPLLDVTFDGRHIMNGDLVSAKPEIVVKLKDENRFLVMGDTAVLELHIDYPNGKNERVNFDDPRVEFVPANAQSAAQGDNTAMLILRPEFPLDGMHHLTVRGKDMSGNRSGSVDYKVSFEIVNKPMISNVLNYPNPFTSSTRFIFTLTGSEVPDNMKIQIMTVSGKVVREITAAELGPIRIGENISEFVWDGTDQYGDPLANGLYFYRVSASQSGQMLDLYQNSRIDRYFESGIGKMYLAR